jgi:glycosyltransferase involved in cell wall biosynthesis
VEEQAKIAIILPAHNEESTIINMVAKLDALVSRATIIVVDNSSTDRTREFAIKAINELKSNSGRLLIENEKGKGLAIRKAFQAVYADVYVMCDADETYTLEHINKLINAITSEGYEMAVADRQSSGEYALKNTRRFHTSGNKIVQVLINTIYRGQLKDVLSGFRALSRNFVETYPIVVSGFELEADMTIHALNKKLSIKEVPSGYRERPHGSHSKLRTYADGIRIMRLVARLARHYHPMAFFGGLSLLLFLIAICIGLFPILDYLEYRYVYRVPLAVLASTLVLASLTMLLVGLVLDSIKEMSLRISARSQAEKR